MNEHKLFQIASKIANPLSIGALALLVLYGIYKTLLGLDMFPKLSESSVFLLLNNVVNRLFVLVLVALVLGILAHTYTRFLQQRSETSATQSSI